MFSPIFNFYLQLRSKVQTTTLKCDWFSNLQLSLIGCNNFSLLSLVHLFLSSSLLVIHVTCLTLGIGCQCLKFQINSILIPRYLLRYVLLPGHTVLVYLDKTFWTWLLDNFLSKLIFQLGNSYVSCLWSFDMQKRVLSSPENLYAPWSSP